MFSIIKPVQKRIFFQISIIAILYSLSFSTDAQTDQTLRSEITNAILKSTKYFDENVSVNGGYVWYYTPDLSRRWGEMEAYPSMVWVQGPGTVHMGNTFLDIYEATKNEYYYKLAEKSARALIKGQLDCGGWNYMIDFAGEESIQKWYDTIGKNGWRLEEFQHFYGNATFDDEVSQGAATFLLRIYLVKHDPEIKSTLDKAIDFILDSQYPLGGWPQRYPVKDKFNKNGNPDYTPYYTFNDNAIWNNIKFLIECYINIHDKKFLDPIKRGMDFFLITQQPNPQAGWSQQYSLDLKPAGARTYEPKALDPQYTARHVEVLIKFYEMTGEIKYLAGIPDALNWIESVKMSSSQNNGFYQLPKFVEIGTNKTLFVHRKGTNVKCGKYFFDYDYKNCLLHYSSIRSVDILKVKDEFEKAKQFTIKCTVNDSLYVCGLDKERTESEVFNFIDNYLTLPSETWGERLKPDSNFAKTILSQMDEDGRWLSPHAFISNPYIGETVCDDSNTEKYSHTRVGDKYDTSPFEDTSDQKYISTAVYIRNVHILLRYLKDISG